MATQSRVDRPNKRGNVSVNVNGWSLNTNSHKWKVHMVVESWQIIPKYEKVKAKWENDKGGLWNKAFCKEYVVYNHFARYWLKKKQQLWNAKNTKMNINTCHHPQFKIIIE
jgi:hypothetical protein